MIKIIDNKHLECSINDTFDLPVLPSYEGEFIDGMQLRFIVSENENEEPLIDKTYAIKDDMTFSVILGDSDKKKISLGEYIYKIITIKNGVVSTEKSGILTVKWGC